MKNNIDNYRQEIDTIDDQLISLLAKRMSVAKKIGEYKIKNNIPPLDMNRWTAVLQSRIEKGKSLKLPEAFTQYLFTVIHEYSVAVQKDITIKK